MTKPVDNEVLADLLISTFSILVEEIGRGLGSWPRDRMNKVTEDIANVIDTHLGVQR